MSATDTNPSPLQCWSLFEKMPLKTESTIAAGCHRLDETYYELIMKVVMFRKI